tara:strand:+ start:52 stop:462 length:411 start_codon:yes stop_codon:yes gene_type:complete
VKDISNIIEDELFLDEKSFDEFRNEVINFVRPDIKKGNNVDFELKRLMVCISPQKFYNIKEILNNHPLELMRNVVTDYQGWGNERIKEDIEKFKEFKYKGFLCYKGIVYIEVDNTSEMKNKVLMISTKIEYKFKTY